MRRHLVLYATIVWSASLGPARAEMPGGPPGPERARRPPPLVADHYVRPVSHLETPPDPGNAPAPPTASEQIPAPRGTVRFRDPGNTTTSLPRVDANMPVDSTLIPGRTIRPIDLVNVLRLAGVRNLDIALARQQVNQALAEMQRTRSLWLPSLFLGPTYYRADGQVQTVQGQVINVNRSSLFLGGTAATVNGFPAPAAGTGYPQLNSLSSVMRISDAIFEPLAAQRAAAASRAAVPPKNNELRLTLITCPCTVCTCPSAR